MKTKKNDINYFTWQIKYVYKKTIRKMVKAIKKASLMPTYELIETIKSNLVK